MQLNTSDSPSKQSSRAKVFISYARVDLAFAERLRKALNGRGFEAYLDKADILPGEPWQERIGSLIGTADTVVFVLSPASVASQMCNWEVNEAERLGKRVLPIVSRETPDDLIPGRLKRLNYIFLRNEDDWNGGIETLATAVETDIGWVREHTRVGGLAERWAAAKDNPEKAYALLPRGPELAEAEVWISQRPHDAPEVTERQREFLVEARKAEQARTEAEKAQIQRTHRFQRRATWALVGVALLVLGGLVAALWQFHETSRREASVFASRAEDAFKQGFCDRALRYTIAGLPPDGALPFSYTSTDLQSALSRYSSGCRLERALVGHEKEVTSSVFSGDGRLILTASKDGTARLWNASTGLAKNVFLGPKLPLSDASFSLDGRHVLTVDSDDEGNWKDRLCFVRVWPIDGHNTLASISIKQSDCSPFALGARFSSDNKHVLVRSSDALSVWETATGVQLLTFRGAGFFSPDGQRAVSTVDGNTSIWDVTTGRQVQTLLKQEVASVSPDGQLILTFTQDDSARLIRASDGSEALQLERHIGPIDKSEFSQDGQRLLMDQDNGAGLWDTATGKMLHHFKAQYGYDRLAISPNGQRVLATTTDHVELWDTEEGILLGILLRRFKPYGAMFTADSRYIVIPSLDETVLYHSHDGAEIARLRGQPGYANAALSVDGKRFATFSDNAVRIWRLNVETDPPINFGEVNSPSLSPDGRYVLGVTDNSIKLWDSSNGALLRTLEGHSDYVDTVQFSPDGSLILSGSRDKTARLWDSARGLMLQTLKHAFAPARAVFCPSGKCFLVVSERGDAVLHDTSKGAEIKDLGRQLPDPAAGSILATFAPDGERLYFSVNNEPHLFDVATGKELATWNIGVGETPSFEDDGQSVVSVGQDGAVKVFESKTGTLVKEFSFGFPAKRVAVNQPKKMLLIEFEDHVRLFDLRTGREERRFAGTDAFFSSDGSQVVTSYPDETARVWSTDTGFLDRIIDGREFRSPILSGDGRLAVATSDENEVVIWDTVRWGRIQTLVGFDARIDHIGFTSDGRILTRDKFDRLVLWNLEPIARTEPSLRRAEICRKRIMGADTFSNEEMLDPVLIGQEGLRQPCDRVGPMSRTYYSNLMSQISSTLQNVFDRKAVVD